MAVGGHVISKDIVIWSFNSAKQRCYLKILIGRFWEKKVTKSGPSWPPIFLSFKKGTRISNFPSNVPNPSVLGPMDRLDRP